MKAKFFAITFIALVIFSVVACGCSKSSDKNDEGANTAAAEIVSDQITAETDKESEAHTTEQVTAEVSEIVVTAPENTAGDVVSESKASENMDSEGPAEDVQDDPVEVTEKEITEVEMDFADFE